LIHIQKYDDKRVLCVAQANIQERKKRKKKSENNERKPTHFSANVNGGLSFSFALSFSEGKLIL